MSLRRRRGAATVELAILAPVLVFLFVATIDFGRVYYQSIILADCARDGALYGSQDPTKASDTAGIQTAALADATDLQPQPSVASITGTDDSGNAYVEVTVTGTFQSLTNYPGIPTNLILTRTVRMRIAPVNPNNS